MKNTYFNEFLIRVRTKFGVRLINMHNPIRDFIQNKHLVAAYTFIADQTPFPEGAYWTEFLHQDTPVFVGTEKIAKKFNYPVVFVELKRPQRGYYEIHGELLCEHPKDMPEGMITEIHTKRLEKAILSQPEIWLWSHRRWKHQRKN